MPPSPQRKVKVGVVGCGVVATAYYLPYLMKHADLVSRQASSEGSCLSRVPTTGLVAVAPTPQISLDGTLVAVCDLDPERTSACARLFGAREQYQDYFEMLARADVEAVFILTSPGTHARFTIAAAQAGKHLLLQKPMATTMEDADAIVAAVRKAGVKALIEPSSNSPVDPDYRHLRDLIQMGALGDVHWFSLIPTGPSRYGPGLGMNPYGAAAFFKADSGGFLFDYAYAPSQIATLLGSCSAVTGVARVSTSEHFIVPEVEYTRFLGQARDPEKANYWDAVLDLPRTERVRMEAPDNVFCTYEMDSGAIGCLHVGRLVHPTLPGRPGVEFQIFGSEGNLIFGGESFASIISTRRDLLPSVDDDGWYHVPRRGDLSQAKWPQPVPGSFNYYHESSRHLIECIVEDRDPIVNVEWGRHVTEMMVGAIESARTGRRYAMSSKLPSSGASSR